MRLNHIGIAAKDAEATAMLLESFGYAAGETLYDANQKVHVRFLHSASAPTIELLFSGGGQPSPVDNILRKNGTCVYHLCYETGDLEKTVQELRKQNYIPLGPKKGSLINSGDVIFLYHKDNVMIELLEVKDGEYTTCVGD